MKNKPIKAVGDTKYLTTIIPSMLKYIERGDGENIGHARNHHTVDLTFSNEKIVRCSAYETKNLIVITWGEIE
jgi:hypothetical protein